MYLTMLLDFFKRSPWLSEWVKMWLLERLLPLKTPCVFLQSLSGMKKNCSRTFFVKNCEHFLINCIFLVFRSNPNASLRSTINPQIKQVLPLYCPYALDVFDTFPKSNLVVKASKFENFPTICLKLPFFYYSL